MNVVLVIFDSLRKDCLGAYGAPPWGQVHTPHFNQFARESLVMTRAFPNALPTLPARVVLYSGQQVYPFEAGDIRLKGDFVGAPGWGPIPEEWPTLAEILQQNGYRTGMVADTYHMFKPSKNFWRGFDQWIFLRGQEIDPARSGPRLTRAQIDSWLPQEIRDLTTYSDIADEFIQQCIMNLHDRNKEEDYFAPRVFKEAALWLEQNQDAENFFLTVESFDPHEPWLVPAHYRKMYMKEEGKEQVITGYNDVTTLDPAILRRTQANYSGAVSLCDRWFGYFMETLRVLGRLEDTLVILTADHGHSLGDGNYLGKRGYPSSPEVFEVPLIVRFPGGENGGATSDMYVQHNDITATILAAANVAPPIKLDGTPFLETAVQGGRGPRDHITIGWGSTPTVVTDRWWFNFKCDGTGVLLYDLSTPEPFARNVALEHQDTVNQLFAVALADAGGHFPDWLVELARSKADAPGCSPLAARPV
jgi:arylsulfatase A-like enzyme